MTVPKRCFCCGLFLVLLFDHISIYVWRFVRLSGSHLLGKSCPLDFPLVLFHTWTTSWETLFIPYANNKGADQLAYLCSWIARFESYLVTNPEDRFSPDVVHLIPCLYSGPIWAATSLNKQNECAPSEDSAQPGHSPSLIRVFDVYMKKSWSLSYLLSAQRRLWSDWADAQVELRLPWAHTHFVGFVMSRFICCLGSDVLFDCWASSPETLSLGFPTR